MREHIKHDVDKTTVHTVEWKFKPTKEGKKITLVKSRWYMTQRSSGFPVIADSSVKDNKTVVELVGGLRSCECPLVNEVTDSEGGVHKIEYLVNTFKKKVEVVDPPETVSTTVSK